MSQCAHCGKRKGKRHCPVVGNICSSCCGTHRGKTIACPETCAYFRRAGDTFQRTFQNIYANLARFVMNDRSDWFRPAVDAFVGAERAVSDWEQEAFIAYLALGYTDGNGRRGIDMFKHTLGRQSDGTAAEVLACIESAWFSLFEVEKVRLDVGFQIQDVAGGSGIFVHERMATHNIWDGQLLLAWVTEVRGHYELVGGATPVPPAHGELVAATLQNELAEAAVQRPDLPKKRLVPIVIPAVYRTLRKAIDEYVPPKVLMEDGEELVLCRAVYEISDPAVVRERLAGRKEIEKVSEDKFVWNGSSGGREDGPLATFAIRTVRLTVEAATEDSMAGAKRFLTRVLGNRARLRTESAQDTEAIWHSRPEPVAGSGPSPGILGDASADVIVDAERPRWDKTEAPEQGNIQERRNPDGHRLPPTAHEAMRNHVPGIDRIAANVADSVRPEWDELRTFLHDDIASNREIEEFSVACGRSALVRGSVTSTEEAAREASIVMQHLFYMANFELHRRKVFWVEESLAWMLAHTDLDVPGELVRLPFPAFALVFVDPATLGLAQSLLADEESCAIRGQQLRVLSVYVVQGERTNQGQGLHVCLLFDASSRDWPYIVSRDLFIRPHDDLKTMLDSHFPDVNVADLDPLFLAPELKTLLHLVVNCILYTTSSHLDPIVLEPLKKRKRRKDRRGSGHGGVISSEKVFYLPGKIEISRVRKLSGFETTGRGRQIMKRFMVRGHWRRAAASWKDQGLRWIEPYWKGPDIAAIVEREYRLKP